VSPNGQSSPGSLQSGQQPSNGIRHIPQLSSLAIHRQTATAVSLSNTTVITCNRQLLYLVYTRYSTCNVSCSDKKLISFNLIVYRQFDALLPLKGKNQMQSFKGFCSVGLRNSGTDGCIRSHTIVKRYIMLAYNVHGRLTVSVFDK
jgi:hypothetical protein